MFKLQS